MAAYRRRRRRNQQTRIGSPPRFGARGYWGYAGSSPVPASVSPPLLLHSDDEDDEGVEAGALGRRPGLVSSPPPRFDVEYSPRHDDIQSRIAFRELVETALAATPAPGGRDTPAPGGYPDDMFTDLTPTERDQYECMICYHTARDPRECPNRHLFCASCIFRWSVSGCDGRAACPVCRTPGRYKPSLQVERVLLGKSVRCREAGCSWSGLLRGYKQHRQASHAPPPPPSKQPAPRPRPADHNAAADDDLPPLARSRYQGARQSYPGRNGGGGRDERYGRTAGVNEENGVSGMADNTDQQIQIGRDRIQSMLAQVREEMAAHERRVEQFAAARAGPRGGGGLEAEVAALGTQLGEVAAGLVAMLHTMRLDSDRCNQYLRALRRGDGLPALRRSLAGGRPPPAPGSHRRRQRRGRHPTSSSRSLPNAPLVGIDDELPAPPRRHNRQQLAPLSVSSENMLHATQNNADGGATNLNAEVGSTSGLLGGASYAASPDTRVDRRMPREPRLPPPRTRRRPLGRVLENGMDRGRGSLGGVVRGGGDGWRDEEGNEAGSGQADYRMS